MAKKPRSKAASNIPPILANAVKNATGVQAAPIERPGQLPDMSTVTNTVTRPEPKPRSNLQVIGTAGKDLMQNLGRWWETGEFREPEEKEEDTEKKKKDTDKLDNEKKKDNLKDLLAQNLKSNNVLENILKEISLLRKLTEGSVKFEKSGRGSRYRDTVKGTYISPLSKTAAAPTRVQAKTSGTTAAPTRVQAKANENLITKSTTPGFTKSETADLGKETEKPAEENQNTLGLPGIDINVGTKSAGPVAGKAGMLSRAAQFMGGKGGLVAAGLAGAVGGGIYAYNKFSEANQTSEGAKAEADKLLAAGEISKEQYRERISEIEKQSTITKGEGIGGGVGRAGGAIAGAKTGAAFGSFFGPAGTVVGGLAGGALGYMAGGSIGEAVGNIGGRISNFFGGNKTDKTENKFTTKSANFSVSENGVTTTGEIRDGKYFINNNEVSEKEYQMVREKLGLSKNNDILSGKVSPGAPNNASEERKKAAEDARQNALADGASPEEADQIAAKMMKYGSVISAGQGRGDVYNGKLSRSDKSESNLSPAIPSKSGSAIQSYSMANKDSAMEQAAPTIINNTTSSPAPAGQQPSLIPLKPQIRPEASSLTRYFDRVAAY